MSEKKWYIIQVVTGYEQKVKDDLENREFDKSGIEEIFLPRKSYTTKLGSIKFKPMFPGYLYVKLEMTDESWFVIRNTNYVTGIVGSSGQRTKPTPVSENEIKNIREKAIEEELRVKNIKNTHDKKNIIMNPEFKVGDLVKIFEGELANQTGKVFSISLETQKVSIEYEMFGRMTKVDVDIAIVKKV